MLKKLLENSQIKLFLTLVAIIIVFGCINPSILTVASFFSLLRASITPVILGLAIMLVMVIGEIDMSYCMICVTSSYATFYFLLKRGIMDTPLILILLSAIAIAVVLELFTWVMVDRLQLNSFIATIGFQLCLKGAVLIFISTEYFYNLPKSAVAFGTTYLASASYDSGSNTVLPLTILFPIVFALLLHFLLEHTSFGRQMYAIGADSIAARRAGINVSRVRLIVFIMVGVLLGFGGVIHDSMARCTMPITFDIYGTELLGFAAVTLGRGGKARAKNTVIGTVLGVLLIQFIKNNLIMIGISTYYQQFVMGVIILTGFIMSMKKSDKLPINAKNARKEETAHV